MQQARHGIVAAALLCPLVAFGQPEDSDGLSDILDCADVEREILRLECYDEAVAAIRRSADSDVPAASSASPPSETAPRAAADDAAPPAPAEAPGKLPQRNAQNPQAAVDVSPARSSAEGDDGERQVTIVEVRTRIPGRAVFVTSAGEEFVQTSGRLRLFLPDVPFQAGLSAGAVGGMFLTPEDTRRSIRIAERD